MIIPHSLTNSLNMGWTYPLSGIITCHGSCLLDKQLDCFLYTIPLTHSLMQMHIYCNYITRLCMCIILNIVNWNLYCYSHVYSIVINWACTVVHTHKHKYHYHNYQNYCGILQIFQWLANFNLANIGGQALFNRFKMAGLILANDDGIANFIYYYQLYIAG